MSGVTHVFLLPPSSSKVCPKFYVIRLECYTSFTHADIVNPAHCTTVLSEGNVCANATMGKIPGSFLASTSGKCRTFIALGTKFHRGHTAL